MSYTVRNLVTDALRNCGLIGVSDTPSADESADAVRTLNRILDGYALSGLTAPGMRSISVQYPAGAEFVEFVRGPATEPWQISVTEIVMRPTLVATVSGSIRETLPYMDDDEYFGRTTISSGTVYGWHWEDNQSPRLFLADAPIAGIELSVIAKCDPHRDVDMNTDISGWRVGLRPLLVLELSAQIAGQNGYDPSSLQAQSDRMKSAYLLSIRTPPPVRRDSSAPGISRTTLNSRQYASGEWL